jgi:hypothetical protein
MAESLRPFETLADRGFQSLMKTGRPGICVPSPSTASRDTKRVFVHSRRRIAHLLQSYDGKLNFEADCWTSPNHRPFMGLTVTFEHNGELLTLVLDVVELSTVRNG